jgi:uncharacterized membrane protein YdjX (TVP38/TMEM64 family)
VASSAKIRAAVFLSVLAVSVIGIYFFGLGAGWDGERLRESIDSFGSAAPLIYIAIFAVAPVLLLPGLPITVAGGLVFGPFWGTVYASIGSTLGAGLAFLTARYFARRAVQDFLGDRWRRVDEGVAEKGWFYVAIARLIPVFPFNLLNYAFGLTRIGFATYLFTSWLFMLPGTAAYVVFSASIFDLLKGKASPAFWIGAVLFLVLFAVQYFYRKRPGPSAR